MESMTRNKKKNVPKSTREMSKEQLAQILKKKKECNAKAQEIVEALCENQIDEDWLLQNLQYINQNHFEDVATERAILKTCGYPLCDNKIEKVIQQQYHISTRYNKVFDVTERKNFCSSSCFRAATHVKNQLFTSPLWFRDQEIIPQYTILRAEKSSLGKEIIFLPDKIKVDKDDVASTGMNKSQNDLEKSRKKIIVKEQGSAAAPKPEITGNIIPITNPTKIAEAEPCNNVIKKKTTDESQSIDLKNYANNDVIKTDASINKMSTELDRMKISPAESETPNKKFKQTKGLDSTGIQQNIDIKHSKSNGNKLLSSIQRLEKSVFEWFSLDTLFFLYGKKKLKELYSDSSSLLKKAIDSRLSIASYDEKIEKMIRLYGLLESGMFNREAVKPSLKPLPNYSLIQQESKLLDIKVKAFYSGSLEVNETQLKEDDKKVKKLEDENQNDDVHLPLIDSQSQNLLRRKILLDKLTKVLPDLLRIFSSDYVLQIRDLRNLVSTFALTAHNITFKPAEWSFVGLVLIKLLSLKDRYLDALLKLDSSQEQLSLILTSCNLQPDYLDKIIEKLTDCNNIIKNLS